MKIINKFMLLVMFIAGATLMTKEPAILLPLDIQREIINKSDTLFDAVQALKNLRATSTTLKKIIDTTIAELIGSVSKKFNVDPLIPAFYIATPNSKKYYRERLEQLKREHASDFENYLSNVLETALSRKADLKQFDGLIKSLL